MRAFFMRGNRRGKTRGSAAENDDIILFYGIVHDVSPVRSALSAGTGELSVACVSNNK
jgi:hypothetical protein